MIGRVVEAARSRKPVRAPARSLVAATLALSLFIPLVQPAPAAGSTWVVNTSARTEAEVQRQWELRKPTHTGSPYTTAPSTKAPYATGTLATGFTRDGLNALNFARYLAGLPDDVRLSSARTLEAQHGAVLLAATGVLTHYPSKPSDMAQSFYDAGYESARKSNIGFGQTSLESFQNRCLSDNSSASNLQSVGHRRWLLNPPMQFTGMGFANSWTTTYAVDRSRSHDVSYTSIAWPSAGAFPVEMFCNNTPWSITLNPATFDIDQSSTQHRVTLRRVADGRTWNFDSSHTNTAGQYFHTDFRWMGVPNVFVFRPDPGTVTYRPGDAFDVTLSVRVKGSSTPRTVSYRTSFVSMYADPAPIAVAGDTRYSTAVEASKRAFPSGLTASAGKRYVVIATGLDWPDALGGSALAGVLDAPVLLVRRDTVPGVVMEEIDRLKADKAVILGGELAIGASVESALRSRFGSSNVERIWGRTRYRTADKIAERVINLKGKSYDGMAFVATGTNFPDALAAAPLAAAKGWPIFLAHPNAGLTGENRSKMPGVTSVCILGGELAVGSSVEEWLDLEFGSANVERIEGRTRYDTAVGVAEYGVRRAGLEWDGVGITTGLNFPDGLAGGVLQGKMGSTMLLTRPRALSTPTDAALASKSDDIDVVTFFGGPIALSLDVRTSVVEAATGP